MITIKKSDFKKIFDSIFDIVLITLQDGSIAYANRSAVGFFGYSIEELQTMNVFQIDVDCHKADIANGFSPALESEVEFETFNRKKDGTRVWVKVRTIGIKEDENQNFFVSTIYDMTMLNKIQQKADFFDVANNITSEAVVIFDLDFRIKEWNLSAEKCFGFTKEEVIDRQIDFLIPEYSKEERQQIKKKIREGKAVQNCKTIGCCKDGKKICLRISYAPLYSERGEIISLLGIFRDMTELEEVEERLREQQKRAVLALEGGNFGIWEMNYSSQKIMLYNEIYSLLGYQREEIGNPFEEWSKYVKEEDISLVREAFSFTEENKDRLAVEFRILSQKEAAYRWFSMKGKVMERFDDGRPKKLVGTYEDITDKKKDELELKKKNEELETLAEEAQAANRAKSLFLANISHELRTPLNGILVAAQMLQEENTGDRNRLLDIIHNSSLTLKGIVTDILDLSKAEHEGVYLNREHFVLSELVQGVYHELQISANRKGLDASCYIDPRLDGEYTGDPQKIKQILNNLISNALKFTQEGMIGIRTTLLEIKDQDVSVEIRIKDTGDGVSDFFQNHLFEAFSQENASDDKRHAGTGLGLAICKKYSEAMGGNILYENNKEKGSTFIFHLLLKQNIEKDMTAVIPTPFQQGWGSDYAGKLILCVDDNTINQELITMALRQWGLQEVTAYKPEEALLEVERRRFDLILMDIQMPGINGYQLTELIRKSQINAETPIMAMTAYARMEDREKCLKAGMDEYVIKPIDLDILFEKIGTLVNKMGG